MLIGYFILRGGITLEELNEAMDDVGLALPTMPGVDLQTFAGAISTATHGSNKEYSTLSDLVRSLVLITSEGKAYRIEPANGITDPDKYNEEGIELIQNDDWFYSATVSMGCLGIIYSCIIEVIPSYFLEEMKEVSTWPDIKQRLIDGSAFDGNRHPEVLINPYEVDGENKALILTHRVIQPGEIDPTGISDFIREFSFITRLADSIPFSDNLLRWFLDHFPRRIPGVLNTAIDSLEEERFVGKSYQVLNQGIENIKSDGTAVEIAFPLTNNKYLEAVDRVIELLNIMKSEGNQYMTSPVSLRFGGPSKPYLSMHYAEHGEDYCTVDLPMLFDTYGQQEIYERLQVELYKMGGRPHWGKVHDRFNGRALISAVYPKFDRWLQVFEELNANGTFNNTFTDRTGISQLKVEFP